MSSQPWYNQPDTYGKSANGESGGAEASSAAKSMGKGALKVASAAGRGIAKGAQAMSNFAANNPWGIRLFSFIASVSLFVIALLGLIGVVGTGSEKTASFYLFNAYMLFLALMLFIAECKDEWPGFGRVRPWVMEQFGFLQSNLGRGSFLVFVGIVWFGAWGWTWGLAGFACMGVGLLYGAAHWRGSGLPASEQEPQSTSVTARPAPKQGTGSKHMQLEEDDSDLP